MSSWYIIWKSILTLTSFEYPVVSVMFKNFIFIQFLLCFSFVYLRVPVILPPSFHISLPAWSDLTGPRFKRDYLNPYPWEKVYYWYTRFITIHLDKTLLLTFFSLPWIISPGLLFQDLYPRISIGKQSPFSLLVLVLLCGYIRTMFYLVELWSVIFMFSYPFKLLPMVYPCSYLIFLKIKVWG